jgi:hypothetical protein
MAGQQDLDVADLNPSDRPTRDQRHCFLETAVDQMSLGVVMR